MTDEPVISSRQNPRFKAALALRDARERRQRQRFLVDGAREIGRALDAGSRVAEAWICPDRVRSDAARALLPRLTAGADEVIEVPAELLARLAYGERDEGIVAVVEARPSTLDALVLPDRPLVAVIEAVEKPGNVGAVLRSADGAGVDAVIVADAVADLWNPNTIRASLGTIFGLPLASCPSAEALGYLRGLGIDVVAAQTGIGALIFTSRLLGRTDLVFVGILALGLMGLFADFVFRRVVGRLAYRYEIHV